VRGREGEERGCGYVAGHGRAGEWEWDEDFFFLPALVGLRWCKAAKIKTSASDQDWMIGLSLQHSKEHRRR
jgi:hypothetical protein